MALYSKDNQYPISQLPDRIRLSDGSTRTGGEYTEEEIFDAGYRLVEDKPELPADHLIVDWNTSDGNWYIRRKTKEDNSIAVQNIINDRLRERHQLILEAEKNAAADAWPGVDHRDIYINMWKEYRRKLEDIMITESNMYDVKWPPQPRYVDADAKAQHLSQINRG